MLLIYLLLIQSQEPRRISWLVWTVAIVVFVAGLSMLIYFLRRIGRSDQEAEADWNAQRRKLFDDQPAPESQEPIVEAEPALVEEEILAPQPQVIEPPAKIDPSAPAAEVSSVEAAPAAEAPLIESAPAAEVSEPVDAYATDPLPPIKPEPREVEPLMTAPAAEEAAVFDDEVWAELERKTEQAARVEQRPTTGALRMGREPFEPPSIEIIIPRDQVPETRPLARPHVEPVSTKMEAPLPQPQQVEVAAGKPASIPGLPEESSGETLGASARSDAETSISSLASYGKQTNGGGGIWGTVTLIAVIALIAGSVFAYYKSSWVHEKVDSLVARIRGSSQTETARPAQQPDRPRAQIFSATPEANKNLVKAKGAVYNISGETMTGLAVEVTLERGDGAPQETRTLALKPAELAPQQQGIYEFEYDGKQFTGYTVTRLLSDSSEVKFIAPARRPTSAQ